MIHTFPCGFHVCRRIEYDKLRSNISTYAERVRMYVRVLLYCVFIRFWQVSFNGCVLLCLSSCIVLCSDIFALVFCYFCSRVLLFLHLCSVIFVLLFCCFCSRVLLFLRSCSVILRLCSVIFALVFCYFCTCVLLFLFSCSVVFALVFWYFCARVLLFLLATCCCCSHLGQVSASGCKWLPSGCLSKWLQLSGCLGKWLQVAATDCTHLQRLIATCRHVPSWKKGDFVDFAFFQDCLS